MATELKIGDSVSVPGAMYGTLKYIGPVQGKKGVFAGVQLAREFATRGKNSGDVEGKYYFHTSLPGSGIFLPAEKAEKRRSAPSYSTTPAQSQPALNAFNQGGRASSAMAGTLPKPNFSQSVGPGSLVPPSSTGLRAQSPALRHPVRRESLPRPSSPLRKPPATVALTPAAGRLATPKTRPSLGFSRSTIGTSGTPGGGLRSPSDIPGRKSITANRFGQSVGGPTKGLATPGRLRASVAPRSEASTTGTSEGQLGPESAFDEEEEDMPSTSPEQPADSTPTPAVRHSFKSTMADAEESKRLKEQLVERDRQLEEQSASIAEMERSLTELQQMMASGLPQVGEEDEERLPKDVQLLRTALRDKNEKIKMLTAEFDVNRADFRSTIDTLEMASTETERVYEKRVEDLLEELRGYQERNEDVESVHLQFRQLEELVAGLEEGLEDARRGEAEARGEVEFLRGEVERSRSEMRRDRERSRAGDRLNGVEPDGGNITAEEFEDLQVKMGQRENEIRGLKAIIQNLNDNIAANSPDAGKTPRANGIAHKHSKTKSTNTVVSVGNSEGAEHLQQQFRDLESLLDSGNFSEADLREEVQKLRKSVQFGTADNKFNVPGLGISNVRKNGDLQKHMSTATSSTASTARPGSLRSSQSGNTGKSYQGSHRRKDTGVPDYPDAMHPPLREEVETGEQQAGPDSVQPKSANPDRVSISGKTDASSNVGAWCEICEESGHDILTCNSMGFSSNSKTMKSTTSAATQARNSSSSGKTSRTTSMLRPLSDRDAARDNIRRSRDNPYPPPATSMPPPPPPPLSTAMAAARDKEKDKEGVDRPAPLSMGSRQSSSTVTSPTTPTASTVLSSALNDKTHDEMPGPRTSSLNAANDATNTTTLPPVENTTTPTPTTGTTIAAAATSTTTNSNSNSNQNSNHVSTNEPTPKPKLVEGTGDQAGMLAGKETGVIDPNKWCALCERDGHDSVDCPIEDVF